MTPKPALWPGQLAVALQAVWDNGRGPKEQHKIADRLLCDQLRALGYGEAVDLFRSLRKWYS